MGRISSDGLRRACLALASGTLVAACSGKPPEVKPQPAPAAAAATPPSAPETVTVRDPELEQRVARLELRLLERDAQVEELDARLADARQEVVRAMAKLQTLATRAEAASGMAEAEVALQSLRTTAGPQAGPEIAQATQLQQMSATEFDKQNYGGALYLATQAKSVVGVGKGRVTEGEPGSLRPGEVLFALPLRLQTVGRSNVREGPGAGFKVLFTLESGTPLAAYSFVDQWVRITDESGRSGWVHYSLVGRRQQNGR